jgi:UDP-glucose 4-epimerase
MKILCTGGAGYVGSACLRWLIHHGHDAIAYDNMLEGNRGSIPADRLIVGDVEDKAALIKAMRDHRIEAVMHFAALASVPDSIREPERYWRTNVLGTKNVLDAMLEVGVQRIVFSSTAATYSFSVEMPITETSDQKPETPYGTTKLSCEWMIREYSKAYGIGFALLRYFNASGADPDGRCGEDRYHESHLIPLILQVPAGRREKVLIFGTDWPTPDGSCVRDFVHTEDLASAHQLALEAMKVGSGTAYNVGSGTGTTVLQVLRACEEAVGRPIAHEFKPRRPGDPAVLVASSQKLRTELGWQPKYPDIRDIVATAWKWHSTHPHGYGEKVARQA